MTESDAWIERPTMRDRVETGHDLEVATNRFLQQQPRRRSIEQADFGTIVSGLEYEHDHSATSRYMPRNSFHRRITTLSKEEADLSTGDGHRALPTKTRCLQTA